MALRVPFVVEAQPPAAWEVPKTRVRIEDRDLAMIAATPGGLLARRLSRHQ